MAESEILRTKVPINDNEIINTIRIELDKPTRKRDVDVIAQALSQATSDIAWEFALDEGLVTREVIFKVLHSSEPDNKCWKFASECGFSPVDAEFFLNNGFRLFFDEGGSRFRKDAYWVHDGSFRLGDIRRMWGDRELSDLARKFVEYNKRENPGWEEKLYRPSQGQPSRCKGIFRLIEDAYRGYMEVHSVGTLKDTLATIEDVNHIESPKTDHFRCYFSNNEKDRIMRFMHSRWAVKGGTIVSYAPGLKGSIYKKSLRISDQGTESHVLMITKRINF
jgi:hypothetical protein